MKNASLMALLLYYVLLSVDIKNEPLKISLSGMFRQTFKQEETERLQVKTKISQQSYCKGKNNDKDVLVLKLLITYRNLGNENIILYKYSQDIVSLYISRTVEESARQIFEVQASQTLVTDGKKLDVDNPVPGTFFIILKPGESHKVPSEVFIEVSPASFSKDSALTAGEHYLQVKIATWPESNASPLLLNERWARFGRLWSKSVITKPMKFNIVSKRTVRVACH